MEVIAIINQKGGVGKSTTAEALAAGLNKAGKRTLAIELDTQGNLSRTARAQEGFSVLDVLTGRATAAEAVQHTDLADVIPANPQLNSLERQITDTGKEYRLKEAIEQLAGSYDYIVIDTPPALSLLTVNALTACNSVVIPAEASIYSLEGVAELAGTINAVQKYTNPNLTIKGILLTKYNPRTILTRDLTKAAEGIAAKLGTKVFDAKIRNSVLIGEAQATRKSIFAYKPKSSVAGDYKAFIAELTGVTF